MVGSLDLKCIRRADRHIGITHDLFFKSPSSLCPLKSNQQSKTIRDSVSEGHLALPDGLCPPFRSSPSIPEVQLFHSKWRPVSIESRSVNSASNPAIPYRFTYEVSSLNCG